MVIILGSVHKGEEEAVKAAALAAGRHGARIVIAPRRIENLEWIEEALKSHGYGIARRSANDVMSLGDNKLVPVIDTFGELGRIYAVSDIAFTGGSFIPHGGQNPLEPAGCGLPVLFGPDMSNFDEASKALENAGGAWRVQSGEELSSRLERLIDDKALRLKAGASARGMVEKGRGAVDRAREKILELAGACD